jgi:hypothetical protein
MKPKIFATAGLALLLGLAAYWYWSPFLAVRQLQTAAQNGDAAEFNRHVDYPRVRDSLKAQFSALVEHKLGAPQDSGNPLAALGSLVGRGLVNPLVDALGRPETVMEALKHGRLAQPAPGSGQAPASESARPDGKPHWIIDRQGVNRMAAFAIDPDHPDQPNAERLGLVFERSGFVDWKLTEIRLPASALPK